MSYEVVLGLFIVIVALVFLCYLLSHLSMEARYHPLRVQESSPNNQYPPYSGYYSRPYDRAINQQFSHPATLPRREPAISNHTVANVSNYNSLNQTNAQHSISTVFPKREQFETHHFINGFEDKTLHKRAPDVINSDIISQRTEVPPAIERNTNISSSCTIMHNGNLNDDTSIANKTEQTIHNDGTLLDKYQDAYQYRSKFQKLIAMEVQAEKIDCQRRCVHGLTIKWERINTMVTACFTLPEDKKDIISLFLNKKVTVECRNSNESESWKHCGYITNLAEATGRNLKVGVSFDRSIKPPVSKQKNCSLLDTWNSSKNNRIEQALDKFVKEEGDLSIMIRNSVLGNVSNRATFTNEIPLNFTAPNLPILNSFQKIAMLKSLKHPFNLIQGPPGTGKTVTSASITYALAKLHGEKMLVSASSNVAVDTLAEKINLTGLNIVRVYANPLEDGYGEVRFPVLNRMVQKIYEMKEGNAPNLHNNWAWEHVQDVISKGEYALKQRILQKADVVLCTCVGAGDRMLSRIKFQTVLIDEATQANEPECLIPLVKASRRIILVGDHMQLRPVVLSHEAEADGLKISLFERFVTRGYPVNLLHIQFRMHPFISQFSSNHFYQSKILDGTTIQDRTDLKTRLIWPNPNFPMMFFSSLEPEDETEDTHSFYNTSEALKSEAVIGLLSQCGVPSSQIGVITPYTSQRYRILRLLKKNSFNRYKSVEINSIDAFQGREKDYIIISCVRSNKDGRIGFLNDERRLNVALTRARYGLIIIGNPQTLGQNKFWRQLLNYCRDNHSIVEGPIRNLKPYKKKY